MRRWPVILAFAVAACSTFSGNADPPPDGGNDGGPPAVPPVPPPPGPTDSGTDGDTGTTEPTATGTPRWVDHFGTSDGYHPVVAIDKLGNTYLAATYAVDIVGPYDAGSPGDPSGVLVTKIDPTGAVAWIRVLVADGINSDLTLAVDAQNLLLVGGAASAATSISIPPFTLTDPASFGFVARLDPADGHALWADRITSTDGTTTVHGVAESGGIVVVTGQCAGAQVHVETPSGGVDTAIDGPTGGLQVCVIGLDRGSGSKVFAKSAGTDDDDRGVSVTADDSGGFYVAALAGSGTWKGSWTGLLGPVGSATTQTVVARMDSMGTVTWAKRFGSDNTTFRVTQIAVNHSGGSLGLVGAFDGHANVGGGIDAIGGGAFVVGLTPTTGIPTFAHGYPGFLATSAAIDEAGQMTLAAEKTLSPTAFGDHPITATDRGVVAKLAAGGATMRWVRSSGSAIGIYGVGVSGADGKIAIAGDFTGGAVDFGTGTPQSSAMSGTYVDTFVEGLDP